MMSKLPLWKRRRKANLASERAVFADVAPSIESFPLWPAKTILPGAANEAFKKYAEVRLSKLVSLRLIQKGQDASALAFFYV